MVSKLEMQGCLDAAVKLITETKGDISEEQTEELLRMVVFTLGGFLECVFDIRESLETLAQSQIVRDKSPGPER